MTMDFCHECGNRGFDDKECPECHRPPSSMALSRLDEDDIKKIEEKFKLACIPDVYHGVEWSYEVFWSHHPEYVQAQSSVKYQPLDLVISRMRDAHNFFSQNAIPKRSVIIILPPHMSKMVWAYSCMQFALKAGYSVAPIFDSLEIQGFMGAGHRNPSYRMYGSMTLEEYVMCDVVFITITKGEQRKGAYSVVRELMDRRARKNKPTFIISEFGIEEFSDWDETGYSVRILNPHIKGENPLKVPIISAFKEPDSEKRRNKKNYVKSNK